MASVVFCTFAVLGEAVFSNLVKAELASFQIFGGIVFLLIGVQFVFNGPAGIEILRGESKYVSGAIAMPVLIGPGTISASIVIGRSNDLLLACAAVIAAVFLCVLAILILKTVHDFIRPRREALVERYFDIAGRVTALFVGTIAIDMVMRGVLAWSSKF